MVSFESVKSRLDREQSLSFLEFNYMILQAYDFLELNRRYGCLLQMGGSDQWGNIVNGIDLTRRVLDHEIYGLTSPLLTTSDGKKMGKSAGGAIWLNADMLSPYNFWQFWRNTTDADTGRFLKLYTDLPVAECERLGALQGAEINAAKIILANEVTSLTEMLRVFAMPVITLCCVISAQMIRMTRAAVIDALKMPYVEMALLKGASRRRLVMRHALPNAIGPIVNAVALSLSYLLGGVIIVETIFNYPGIAKLMVDAVATRDLPLIQTCAMIFCLGYLLLITLADIIAILSNPKLRK